MTDQPKPEKYEVTGTRIYFGLMDDEYIDVIKPESVVAEYIDVIEPESVVAERIDYALLKRGSFGVARLNDRNGRVYVNPLRVCYFHAFTEERYR